MLITSHNKGIVRHVIKSSTFKRNLKMSENQILEEDSDIIYLCASISHYSGKPLSILSFICKEEDDNLVLGFTEAKEYDFNGKNKFTLITDSTVSSDFDVHFKPEDFHDALQAFYELNTKQQIDFDDSLLRFAINENIQPNGVNENGKIRYEIDSLSNGNIAILATCLYFINHKKSDSGLEACLKLKKASESLYDPELGSIFSIF